MSASPETREKTLLGVLLSITIGLIFAGFWWASEIKIESLIKSSSQPSQNNPPKKPKVTYNFAQVTDIPSGVFNYGGSTTWAPIRKTADSIIKTTWSEYKLRYTNPVMGNPGSGTGIHMLLEGQLSFAQSSRPLKEEEYEQAKRRGFSFQQIPVAIDGIAIAVHPALSISGLTLAQIQEIYTGKLTNWQQLGGADLPIVPYSRKEEEGGTVAFFVDNVLAGQNFGENIQLVSSTTEAIRALALNPGGIYYATTAEIVPQCQIKSLPIGREKDDLVAPYTTPPVPTSQCPQKRNQINKKALQSGKYPISRRLFVIVKQNGEEDEAAGLAYAKLLLSDQGQELIDRAGFIRIH